MLKKIIILSTLLLASCVQEEYDYSAYDLGVGKASIDGAVITVKDGLAVVQSMESGLIELWLQSPVINVTLDLANSAQNAWQITMKNSIAGMSLLNPGTVSSVTENQAGTVYVAELNMPAGLSYDLNFSTIDYQNNDSYSFALLSDVQEAMDSVDDFYYIMNNDNSLRYVISAGDLTSNGEKSEIDKYYKKLTLLNIPFYTTNGNHDIFGDNQLYWRKVFGRTSFTFKYKDIKFIFADSSLGTIENRVYGWLDTWLLEDRNNLQFFITHYPAIDPSGVRSGSLNSKNEAYKLIAKLLEGDVDVILNGHVHSYYHFDTSGIDTYISGGGGAYPELYDNIERHYLKITVNGGDNSYSVEKIEID